MDVWTIQISRYRLLHGTDIEFVDITLKSGILDFAPTPKLLYDHKRGAISDETYRREYRVSVGSAFNVIRYRGPS
jgi:hypothetical protein